MNEMLIVGAGQVGTTFLQMVLDASPRTKVAIADFRKDAPGIQLAKQRHLPISSDWKEMMTRFRPHIVVEATGNRAVYNEIRRNKTADAVVIPYSVARLVSDLGVEKERLIEKLKSQSYQNELIINLTQDAMIAIDCEEKITLFNKSAERMTGLQQKDVIGKAIGNVLPSTRLPRVLKTGRAEILKEQVLDNGLKIITTRIPMADRNGRLFGAFAVFKDVTEIERMAEEVTNLKSIQKMLEAIIYSSEDAITVVDGDGKGIMINPAYTRLTGLKEEEVIGKPATIDISEGESMHLKVLKTGKPVRGARMKVGPGKRDVIVNASPVIVDGEIKGSVALIHDMSEITSLTDELNKAHQIIRTLEAKYSFDDIVSSSSDQMRMVIEQAQQAARTPVTILLRGESGTGKELFAHAIHNASERKFHRFVRVNCAAISESLLESELFGYEEGAFSGARRGGKRGLFEEADGGTIFLDEIGELSPNTQAKLLRVLQENEIVRVGGTKAVPISVRVIAATNVNLEKRMAEGLFRRDLYYRLYRMPIWIPPLRERKEDLPALCRHLLRKLNREYGRNVEGISQDALEILKRYDWPGNVRELENILGRAMIHMRFHESEIRLKHLAFFQMENSTRLSSSDARLQENLTLAEQVDAFERQLILRTLKKYQYNKTKTARALNISVRNLYYKLQKWDISKTE